MKRTTVFIDERTLTRLQRAAERRGVSAASLVREAVDRYLDAPRGQSSLPSITGSFASGNADTADEVDRSLWRDPHA